MAAALWLVAAAAVARGQFMNGNVDAPEHLDMPAGLKVVFLADQGLRGRTEDVLKMAVDFGADFIVHQGDFDYEDDPKAWDEMTSRILGEDYPLFASAGNHETDEWLGKNGYQMKLYERLVRANVTSCSGEVGVNLVCRYKGLLFTMTAPGLIGTDHDLFVQDAFSKHDAIFKVCSFHVNMYLMQIGEKGDEAGWPIYEVCRHHGAIVATGHEHVYARTHLMKSFEKQQIASTSNTLEVKRGESFVILSGLAGYEVRPWDEVLRLNPWWAATAAEQNGVNQGALFCTFNFDGDERMAYCYFQDRYQAVFDQFFVKSGNSAPSDGPTGGSSKGDDSALYIVLATLAFGLPAVVYATVLLRRRAAQRSAELDGEPSEDTGLLRVTPRR